MFNIKILFLLFLTYSFLGWVMEMIVTVIEDKEVVNRGFLVGPYCPIYGVCTIAMILLLNKVTNPILLFILSIIICSIGEYLTSYILEKIFMPKKGNVKDFKTHTVHYGEIISDNKKIDEVLVIVMKAPNTYTKEDVVEIDCHGGALITRKILDLILKNGARTADPGEFTKRAFLNGRIDLSQAEAVMDIINAKNEIALNTSVSKNKNS